MTEASQKAVAIYQHDEWCARVLALALTNATFAAASNLPDKADRLAAAHAMLADRRKLQAVSLAILMVQGVNDALGESSQAGAEIVDSQILGPIENNLGIWGAGILT